MKFTTKLIIVDAIIMVISAAVAFIGGFIDNVHMWASGQAGLGIAIGILIGVLWIYFEVKKLEKEN